MLETKRSSRDSSEALHKKWKVDVNDLPTLAKW